MRRLLLTMIVMAAALLAAPGGASAATCNFQGPGVDWDVGANWDCLVVPDANDTAVIGSGDAVTVDSAQAAEVLSFTGGTLNLSGDPTLTVADNADGLPTGAMTATSGTIQGNGTVTVTGASTGYSKTTAGQLTVQNGADLVLSADGFQDGGSICLQDSGGGDPSLQIDAQLAISTGADTNAFNCNGGLDGAAVRIGAAGLLIKEAAGLTQLLTPMDNDGALMTDAGTLTLFGGQAGAVSAGLYSTNGGATTNFQSAHTLTSSGEITGAGTTVLNAAVTVPDGGTFTPTTLTHNGGTLTLGGVAPTLAPVTYNLQGGVLQSTRPLQPTAALNVTSGVLQGNFTTTIASPTTLTKTTTGGLTVQNQADLILNRDVNLDGGSICVQDAGGGDPSLQINAVLTITANADTNAFNCNGGLDGPAILIGAAGQLVKSAAGLTQLLTPMDNDGQITVSAGSLSLFGGQLGATWAGSLTTAAAATTTFQSAHTLAAAGVITGGTVVLNSNLTVPDGGTFTPTTLTHNGGTLTLGGVAPTLAPVTYNLQGGVLQSTRPLQPTAALNVTSGVLQGNFTTTIASPTTLTKTTTGGLTVQNQADLILNRDVNLDGGSICVQDAGGGDPSLQINAVLTITANADTNAFNCNGGLDGPAILIGAAGQLVKSAAGLTQLLTPMDNDGQITVSAGSLSLFGGQLGATWAGSLTTAAAATTTFQSAHTLAAAGVITGGTVVLNSNLTVPDGGTFTPTTLTHNGGTLTLGGVAPTLAPVTYNLQGGVLQSTRPLQPTAALNVTSGVLQGNFTTTIASPTTLTKTTTGGLTVQNQADLILNRDVNLDGGSICVQDAGGGDPSLQINAVLTITANADTNAFNCNGGLDGPAILIGAAGQLVKSAAGLTQLLTPMDNDGQITVSAGSLSLFGGQLGATWAGSLTTAAAATTTFQSAHTLAAAGVITGGTVVLNSNLTVPDGGTFTPTTLTHNGGTLTLGGVAPTLAPVTYNLQGGVLQSTRPLQPTAALNVTSGVLQGNFTTTIASPTTLTKTTTGGLTVQNQADLILNRDVNLDGGSICVQDAGGGDPSLQINAVLTITANADTNAFNCNGGLDGPGIFINAGGQLVKSSNNLTQLLTPTRVAGGSLTVASSQMLSIFAAYQQTAGQTTIAAGGTVGGNTTYAISGGTFTVNGALTGSPTVTATGVLTGTGTITGTVTNTSGIVRPGASPGTLTITGPYAQGAGGTLEVEVEGTTPGSGFDVLAVSGSASLGGTVKVLGSFDPALSDIFQLLTSGSRSGTFAALDAPALGGGKAYQLDYPGSPNFGARLVLEPPQPPVNTSPPTITGTAELGQTLTCLPGAWDNNPTFTFQWLRDGQAIGGATSATYLAVAADVTHQLSCRVTATNPASSVQATTSAVTVPAMAPQNAAPPTISGAPALGATLSCAPGTWSGEPAPAFTFAWLREGQPIDGATSDTYAVTAADVTRQISCRVTAANAGGSASATSAAVSVPATGPSNTAPPTISGSDTVGSTLTCSPGTWTGVPAPTLSFLWLRGGQPIAGATGATYVLTDADGGKAITCRVSAANAAGTVSATSAAKNAAKAPEQVLAASTTEQVATAIGLPSAKKCLSRRNFSIRIRQPRGVKIRAAKVLVNGRSTAVRKIAGRFQSSVDLRGLPKGRFTVRITITTTSGIKLVAQRRYKTCAPKAKRT